MIAVENRKFAVKDEFDSKASVYDSYRLAGWYQAHNDLIARHLPASGPVRLLDVGCATGYLIRTVLGANPEASAIGIDLSPRMVAVAREGGLGGRASFFHDDWEDPGDALVRELAPRSVTHAACASVLHYFNDPVAALRRIGEALEPGGSLYLLERRRESSPITQIWDLAHRHVIRDNVRFYSSTELLEMIGRAGFRHGDVVEHTRKYFWKNKISTNLSLIRATA